MTCICLFVILPLTLVGTVLGRNLAGQPDYPCRINAVPRPIPEKKWFMEPGVIILLGGVLPFASIFIEMYVFLLKRNAFELIVNSFSFVGTSFLRRSGPIKSTMCMVLCCSSF